MRWKAYFDALEAQMESLTKPDPELLGSGSNSSKTADELFQMALPQEVKLDYYAMEEPWTLKHNTYVSEPVGDPVDLAVRAMQLIGMSVKH